jgi:hypothetical protein
MKRHIAPIVALMLASCSAPAPVADSLCKLPRNLAGWQGSEVRWQGLVIGTPNHGYALITEDCQHRGIPLDWQTARSGHLLDETSRWDRRPEGLVRVDVSGRISHWGLVVSDVHRVVVIPMNFEAEKRHVRALGF